tara:strand:+ start:1036 stop:1356 length:321 start_codon:yes stop_codon:yes gene_type:complete
MNSSDDTLLRAILNRLTVRIGEKLTNAAADITLKAKDAPDQLKKEWEILKEEIYTEAERIKNENTTKNSNHVEVDKRSEADSSLEKIDIIRSKVSELNKLLDKNNS